MKEAQFLQQVTRVDAVGGAITRFIRSDESDFDGFGEVYFTSIDPGAVKAWRRHGSASLCLTVPYGKVLFALITEAGIIEFSLCSERPERLRIPSGIWFGFSGLAAHTSVVCSFSNIPHDPAEVERRAPEDFQFNWSRP